MTVPRCRQTHRHTTSLTYVWNNNCKLGIQSVIDFSNGPLVTPERVVILSIFCVGVSRGREDLVPECGVAVRVGNTVWWLSAGKRAQDKAQRPDALTRASPTAQAPH